MSRLYVTADSDAIKVLRTARGHRRVSAHARTWDEGAAVYIQEMVDGLLLFSVYRTAGSNGAKRERLICSWREGGPIQYADEGDSENRMPA